MSECSGLLLLKLIKDIKYSEKDFVGFLASRKYSSLFEILVAVMLTQNTSDVNAFRALQRLEKLVGRLTPESILNAPLEELSKAIRPAGMHRQRAIRLHEVAKLVCKKYKCSLDHLCNLNVNEARSILMALPGVGAKTADVVLLMYCGMPVFPVDTHIFRISLRLGIVDKKDYDIVSGWFRSRIPRDKLLDVHLKLIMIGRLFCKPRNPLCSSCPLRVCCKHALSSL